MHNMEKGHYANYARIPSIAINLPTSQKHKPTGYGSAQFSLHMVGEALEGIREL